MGVESKLSLDSADFFFFVAFCLILPSALVAKIFADYSCARNVLGQAPFAIVLQHSRIFFFCAAQPPLSMRFPALR